MKDGWSFCAYCGTDNRQPSLRHDIPHCDHQIEAGEFCVQCGHSVIDIYEPQEPESRWREVFGWLLLLGGLALLTFSQIQRGEIEGLGKEAPDYARKMANAYGAGRIGFILIPAGIFMIVVMGRRWRLPWLK